MKRTKLGRAFALVTAFVMVFAAAALFNPTQVQAADWETIWELDITPELAVALNDGYGSAPLGAQQAGPAHLFMYANGALDIMLRTDGWNSMDILLRDRGLTAGATYRLIVVGSSTEAFQLQFPLSTDPWETGTVTGDATGATIEFTSEIPNVGGITPGYDEDGLCLHRIRIRTTGTADYTVQSVIIQRLAGAAAAPGVGGEVNPQTGDSFTTTGLIVTGVGLVSALAALIVIFKKK